MKFKSRFLQFFIVAIMLNAFSVAYAASWKEHRNETLGVSVKTPASWKVMNTEKDLNITDSQATLDGKSKGVFIMFLSGTAKQMGNVDDPVKLVTQFAEKFTSKSKETAKVTTLTRAITVEGQPAAYRKYEGEIGGKTGEFTLLGIINHGRAAIAIAIDQSKGKHSATLKKVIRSMVVQPVKNASAEKAAAASQPQQKTQKDTASQAQPAQVDPSKPGPAYFAVKKVGLVRLQKGVFSAVKQSPENIKAMAVAPDGTLWFTSYKGVFKLKAGKIHQISDYKTIGHAENMAFTPNGHIWTVSYKGVGNYNGREWKFYKKTDLGADAKLLKDVTVAPSGEIWVISANAVHVWDGDDWSRPDISKFTKRKLYFKNLQTGPSGAVYAAHSKGVIKFTQTSAEKINTGVEVKSFDRMAVGPHDALALTGMYGMVIASADHAPKAFLIKRGDIKAKRFYALTTDGAGRTWMATDHGMVIIDEAGKVTSWTPGTVKNLIGSVNAIAIAGSGPELPKVGPPALGAIVGKVIKEGEPLAGVAVEICASPSSYTKKTPCYKAPFMQTGKTDADGVFKFEEIPLGTYRFAIKAGDKWSVTRDDCCLKMKEGKIFDVGSIKLK